jgi:hypothetical protein
MDHSHLRKVAKDLVALGVEDHEALIKVMVLHGGGRIEGSQGVAGLDLEQYNGLGHDHLLDLI